MRRRLNDLTDHLIQKYGYSYEEVNRIIRERNDKRIRNYEKEATYKNSEITTEELYRKGYEKAYTVHNDNEVYKNNMDTIMIRTSPNGDSYSLSVRIPNKNPTPQQTRIPFPEYLEQN